MIHKIGFLAGARRERGVGLPALILSLLVVISFGLLSAQTTNTAPSTSPTAAPVNENFGQYLADHQDDLAPFFNANGDEMARGAAPLLLGLLGKIMIFTLLACWIFDVALIRWYSARFAPAYAKLKRALIYATGRLVLSVLFYALLGLAIVFVSGLGHDAVIVLGLFLVFLVAEFAVQTGWIHYLYSTPVPRALVCYLCIFAVHVLTGFAVSVPILASNAVAIVTGYIDTNITPKLQAATDDEKKKLADATAACNKDKAAVEGAQQTITDNTSEQKQLQQQIEAAKVSDSYLFSRIVKLRAQGELGPARDQLSDLLQKYPNSPLAGAMKTQLAGIDSDIAAAAAQKQQADAAAAAAAAQARATLLADASKGQATLSEMRLALVGKTPADVSGLFGPPSATESNRWGYDKQMVVNPMTQQKFGLTVYFADGFVQGVDYYYGTGNQGGSNLNGITQ